MSEADWNAWSVPASALLLGAISFLIAWMGVRNFDRRYGRDPK